MAPSHLVQTSSVSASAPAWLNSNGASLSLLGSTELELGAPASVSVSVLARALQEMRLYSGTSELLEGTDCFEGMGMEGIDSKKGDDIEGLGLEGHESEPSQASHAQGKGEDEDKEMDNSGSRCISTSTSTSYFDDVDLNHLELCKYTYTLDPLAGTNFRLSVDESSGAGTLEDESGGVEVVVGCIIGFLSG